jgi:purine nucleosidase
VRRFLRFALIALLALGTVQSEAATRPAKIIIDTDIGDDIDDAFALALALASPEVEVLGVTTAWGDTTRRAKLVGRLLQEARRCDVPIATGVPTKSNTPFTQGAWADAFVGGLYPQAVDFLLDQIRRHPGEITLVALAPMTNLSAAAERDPATFRKLKRIVAMGGSIHRGYGDIGFGGKGGPDAEYNIKSDVAAAQRVFASGVPITLMPLDSTEIRLEDPQLSLLLGHDAPLAALYREWRANNQWKQTTPILFDLVPLAALIDPTLCPAAAMNIAVDGDGFTRIGRRAPNAAVCLTSEAGKLLKMTIGRLSKRPVTTCNH